MSLNRTNTEPGDLGGGGSNPLAPKGGRGGHCPWKVEWLDAQDAVLATSDYERKEKYLSFVCQHRAPTIASHWDAMLAPLVLHHSDKSGPLRYRQLEYYRMPYMAFLALVGDPQVVGRLRRAFAICS